MKSIRLVPFVLGVVLTLGFTWMVLTFSAPPAPAAMAENASPGPAASPASTMGPACHDPAGTALLRAGRPDPGPRPAAARPRSAVEPGDRIPGPAPVRRAALSRQHPDRGRLPGHLLSSGGGERRRGGLRAFETLREGMSQTPPFDTEGFVRNIGDEESPTLVVYFARRGESLRAVLNPI